MDEEREGRIAKSDEEAQDEQKQAEQDAGPPPARRRRRSRAARGRRGQGEGGSELGLRSATIELSRSLIWRQASKGLAR